MQPGRAWLLLATVLGLGCTQPQAGPAALVQLPDRVSHQAASLSVRLDGPAGSYRTQYVRVLDWDQAEATLSHADTTLTNETRVASATVESDNRRTATLSISPIKPATGYTLSVALKRRDASGTDRIIASGSRTGISLASGNNAISVTLGVTAQGHMVVSVQPPQVPDGGAYPRPNQGVVTTIGGNGFSSLADGDLATARFQSPAGLALVGSKLYVSDIGGGHSVRLIDLAQATSSSSYITTLAGGSGGDTLGNKAVATFMAPSAVCMLPGSKLLVADSGNHKIKAINLSLGTNNSNYVSLYAGSSNGFADGDATTAKFQQPRGLIYDGSRYLYVADTANNRIRRIDTSLPTTDPGFVTTFAGSGTASSTDGTGTGASFNAPYGLALDPDGNLYVTDSGSHKIRKITPAGVVSTLAGTSSGMLDGDQATAMFSSPRQIIYHHRQLFVADDGNYRIRKIDLLVDPTSPQYVTTHAGSGSPGGTDGTGTAAQFNRPRGLAANVNGSLYVAEEGGSRVRLIQ